MQRSPDPVSVPFAMSSGLSNHLLGDAERKRVLVVDDEESIRMALGRFLRSRGYDVDAAASAEEALQQVERGRYAIMICDIRMSGMSGLDLLPRIREVDPDLGIMMLSAVNETPIAAEALSLGAMEYLMKPIELGELQLAVERVLHRRNLSLEQRNVARIIEDEVTRKTQSLRRERNDAVHAALEGIATATSMFEARGPWFAGMSSRVGTLAFAMAQSLGLEESVAHEIALAGRVHDIGRVAVPEAILAKSAPLTHEEFARIQGHVPAGLEILAPFATAKTVYEGVRDHHEHWDGTGYPAGRSGAAISVAGRILCAADAFVALSSPRPYRPPLTQEEALNYLASQAGTMLDPAIYDALRRVVVERRLLGLTVD